MKRGPYLKPGRVKELLGPMRPGQVFVHTPDPFLLIALAAISLEHPNLRPGTRGWHGGFADALRRARPEEYRERNKRNAFAWLSHTFRKRSKRALQREVQEAFAWLSHTFRDPRLREQKGIPQNMPYELAALHWVVDQL